MAGLKIAAEMAVWGEALPVGSGRGIAAHFSFGGYVACVVYAYDGCRYWINSGKECGRCGESYPFRFRTIVSKNINYNY